MIRGGTRILFLRAEMASVELRKLLPLLSTKKQGTTASSQSVASLLVSTAFANTTAHSLQSHSRDCPVAANALPLSRVGIEPSFASRPCMHCVRERVHYLASVVFCDDFEQRCSTGAPRRAVASRDATDGSGDAAGLLEREVEACFGSLDALKKSVQEISVGAMSPGRIWIVYSPSTEDKLSGGVNVLSLPGCKVPLAHGLWPLAVVNLSEERVCAELERHTASTRLSAPGGAKPQPPAWSHAARTPSASSLTTGDAEANPHSGAVEYVELSDLQAAVAKRALDTMNWTFVEEQLASALTYYSSAERETVRQDHRKGKEQLAAVRAMSRLKDSGAVIHAADSVTISSPHPSDAASGADKASTALPEDVGTVSAKNAAAATNAGASNATMHDVSNDTDSGALTSPPASSSAGEKSTASTASSPDGESSPSSASLGPLPVQQPDGTWEYHYENGDVTKVRKDGTKVFQTKELTTTVFGNGDTLFEYPNNTSILDRADGVRITTYADSTTKEERLK